MSDAGAPRFARDYTCDGTLIKDVVDPNSGLRVIVIRGGFSFCAYVGVQQTHVFAGLEELCFRCHHSITFKGWGDGLLRPEGWFWWGWDYAHAGDVIEIADIEALPQELQKQLGDLARRFLIQAEGREAKDWTIEEVLEDALDVLMTLSGELREIEMRAEAALSGLNSPEGGSRDVGSA